MNDRHFQQVIELIQQARKRTEDARLRLLSSSLSAHQFESVLAELNNLHMSRSNTEGAARLARQRGGEVEIEP
jgi:hypothetical protein